MTEQYVVEAEPEEFLRGQQGHSGLLRRPVAFALITFYTSRNKVMWSALAALRTGKNVVESQILCVLGLAAVLAAISIANVDPGPFHRRLTIVAADVYVVAQPDDGRHRENGRGRMQNVVSVVFLDENGTPEP
jgi:hypothetical protein